MRLEIRHGHQPWKLNIFFSLRDFQLILSTFLAVHYVKRKSFFTRQYTTMCSLTHSSRGLKDILPVHRCQLYAIRDNSLPSIFFHAKRRRSKKMSAFTNSFRSITRTASTMNISKTQVLDDLYAHHKRKASSFPVPCSRIYLMKCTRNSRFHAAMKRGS